MEYDYRKYITRSDNKNHINIDSHHKVSHCPKKFQTFLQKNLNEEFPIFTTFGALSAQCSRANLDWVSYHLELLNACQSQLP